MLIESSAAIVAGSAKPDAVSDVQLTCVGSLIEVPAEKAIVGRLGDTAEYAAPAVSDSVQTKGPLLQSRSMPGQ